MAKAPASEESLKEQFGPHLNYVPPGGWKDESIRPAERLVKTHCCFCGQQCGIQLKVRDVHRPDQEDTNHGAKQQVDCPGIAVSKEGMKRYNPQSKSILNVGPGIGQTLVTTEVREFGLRLLRSHSGLQAAHGEACTRAEDIPPVGI